jgi:hypothetical protein
MRIGNVISILKRILKIETGDGRQTHAPAITPTGGHNEIFL